MKELGPHIQEANKIPNNLNAGIPTSDHIILKIKKLLTFLMAAWGKTII